MKLFLKWCIYLGFFLKLVPLPCWMNNAGLASLTEAPPLPVGLLEPEVIQYDFLKIFLKRNHWPLSVNTIWSVYTNGKSFDRIRNVCVIKIFTECVLPEAIIGKILSVFFFCFFFLGSLLAISSYHYRHYCWGNL